MKLKHFFCLILFVSFFYSCNKLANKTTILQDTLVNNTLFADSVIAERFENTTLIAYVNFVQNLDTTDAASSLKAVEGFGKYFAGESDRVADTAFVIFRAFYDKLKINLNIKHANDTTDFSPFLVLDNSQVTDKLLKYRNKLQKNGFRIASDEGMTYIEQDWTFVDNKFSQVVTRTMKSYIRQLCTEHNEKAFSDAAFLLNPTQYIDRLIWYEKFIYENPEFLYTTECKDTQRMYLTQLFYGLDNTPLLEDEVLSLYFTEAYSYLQQKYPATKTAKIAKPYFTALQQKQFDRAAKIIEQYEKESVIANYSE